MSGVLQVAPGQPIEVRPLLPALRELDKTQYIQHGSTNMAPGVIVTINVPKGVRYLLVQAIQQNIRYVISGAVSNPSPTSGFQLIAGNDPLAIPVHVNQVIKFVEEAAGAYLEMQMCQ